MSPARIPAFLILFIATHIQGRKGVGISEQDWGYITVRPNVHMFWWLYYTSYQNISNYTERPLIIWLQGGPGMPSSGYGNFLEIGPQNATFHKREGSFVENFNVLFVDNPAGVGYSYISDNETGLVTNGDEIGEDLYNFFELFMSEKHPEFSPVPIYIFGESYGGKMAVELVHRLMKKEKDRRRHGNLKGLALGDSYISPVDYLSHYAPLAFHMGLVDKRGFTQIDELAKQIQVLINKKEFKKAANISNVVTRFLSFEPWGFDLNNILTRTNSSRMPKVSDYVSLLENIMNNEVRSALNISTNVTWTFFQKDLYDSLKGDLVQSVAHKVEELLNTTQLKILVYNGVLDFLVNTVGTLSWLENLNWRGKERWYNATLTPLNINEVSEGYSKRVDNLVFYAILRAGHSVPLDNLPVINEILQLELLD